MEQCLIVWTSLPSFIFAFPRPSLVLSLHTTGSKSSRPNVRSETVRFAVNTQTLPLCTHLEVAFDVSIVICSKNTFCWTDWVLNDASKITAITQYSYAHGTKRLQLWNKGLKTIYRPKIKSIWGKENLPLSCKWKILTILVDVSPFLFKRCQVGYKGASGDFRVDG